MQLTFKVLDLEAAENTLQIDCLSEHSVQHVKSILSPMLNQPPNLLRLIQLKEGHEILLSDDNTILSYDINESSRLLVDIIRPEREEELAARERIKNKRGLKDQQEPAPSKDWLGLLIAKIMDGSLSGLLQLIGEYDREEAGNVMDEEEDLLSTPNADGWTGLHFACQLGHSNIAQLFVARGANCNRETLDNWTPLILASYHGHAECVRALLKHPRIQINKMTATKGTALHQACRKGHAPIVQLLLENNASMTIEDNNRAIPLMVASTHEIFEIIPKYMGERELQKVRGEHRGEMTSFNGEVFYTGSTQIHDRQVLLSLDIDQGYLSVYMDKDNFIKNEEPSHRMRLLDIWDIRVSKGLQYGNKDAVCFIIHSKTGNFKFYTLMEDLTNMWIRRIQDGIDYCQQHKIGMKDEDQNGQTTEELGPREDMLFSSSSTNEIINFKSFTTLEELGSGSFGKVYKVIKNDTKHVYALKQLNKQFLVKHKQLKYAVGECKILRYLSHPFIITMDYAFQTPKHLYMVLEYCPNGDLMTHLSERSRFAESVARFYIAETILAVEYLHSLDIVYRDLKPENILIDRAGHIRLADFGLAKENVNPLNPAMSFCGSPAYLAPEMLSKTGSEKSADVYGIGAILYEFLTGMPPFYSDNIKELFRNIKRGLLQFPKVVKPEAQDLMRKLMNKDPTKRPTMTQAKSHIFFKGIDWEELEKKKVRPPRLGSKWVQLDEYEEEQANVMTHQKTLVEDEDYAEEEELQEDNIAEFNFARA
ncbi:unnamed protein product [Blepharisma stoltei]|uniref:Non-specific serine/threonine protein kinase n=1 Tax=Blepharisma stoltei TaxID=1481888 RepID=A0AAU9IEI3_9CILI|nr:unnamed protein product [Blepharisma stoltei]